MGGKEWQVVLTYGTVSLRCVAVYRPGGKNMKRIKKINCALTELCRVLNNLPDRVPHAAEERPDVRFESVEQHRVHRRTQVFEDQVSDLWGLSRAPQPHLGTGEEGDRVKHSYK